MKHKWMFILEFPCFFYDSRMLVICNLFFGSSASSKSSLSLEDIGSHPAEAQLEGFLA